MDKRYFRLFDHIGVEPPYVTDPKTGQPVENEKAGELQPLREFGLAIQIPTMVGGEIVPVNETLTVYPDGDPLDRTIATDEPLVANVLQAHDLFYEVDPPKRSGGGKAPSIAKLREQADELGIPHEGVEKADLASAIADHKAAQEIAEAQAAAAAAAETQTTDDADSGDDTPTSQED